MLYRASECQKRATSPARVDSSGVNLGGKVATPGSPVTVKTMPVCETEKSHTDSIPQCSVSGIQFRRLLKNGL